MKTLILLFLCGTANAVELIPYAPSTVSNDAAYVNVTGDTMSGPLTLAGSSLTVTGNSIFGTSVQPLITSPALGVKGNISLWSTTGNATLRAAAASGWTGFLNLDDAGSTGSYSARLNVGMDNIAGAVFHSTSTSATFYPIVFQTGAVPYRTVIASNGNLTIPSSATVKGSAFSVGGSTLVVANGLVGIGTTAPAQKLEVNGSIISSGTIYGQNGFTTESGTKYGDPVSGFQTHSTGTKYILYDGSADKASIGWGSNGIWIQNVANTNPNILQIYDNSTTPRVTIVRTTGNMGLGTALPKATLDVVGGIGSYSRTMAQLLAITPGQVGVQYFCNNCTPAKMVVSTGTSAGNFADIMGGTFE